MSRTHATRPAGTPVTAALAFVLAAAPLAACTTGTAADDGASFETAAEVTGTDDAAWQTLGEALGDVTTSYGSGWNDEYYVVAIERAGSVYRVVARMEPGIAQAIDDLDWSDPGASARIDEIASTLPVVSVQDLTAERAGQAELEALVGRTGSELLDSGFTFTEYYMYGGELTGTYFDKGPFRYEFTFDVSVPESDTQDGGASVLDATVTEAGFFGVADSVIDPTDPL